MTFDKEKAMGALRAVNQPGTGTNIVEGGALRSIEASGNEIQVKLVIHTPSLNIRKKLESQIKIALEGLYPEGEVKIGLEVEKLPETEKAPKSTTLKDVKYIIAIASGKGGVGKSTLSANLAVTLAKMGYALGLVDADIYGPSIPVMFDMENAKPLGIETEAGKTLISPTENYGVKVQSIGFFAKAGQAMVWRGSMATKALQQMIFDTDWGALDFLLIDLPPGTGDIHLSLVQEVKLDGVVIISTPQSVALNDAVRGIDMFRNEHINVPILGVVENMAYFTPAELPQNKYYIFGQGGARMLAADASVPFLGEIPLVQSIREAGDAGRPIAVDDDKIMSVAFRHLAQNLLEQLPQKPEADTQPA